MDGTKRVPMSENIVCIPDPTEALTEINRTVSDGAANVVGDSHRQIVSVNETDVVPVQSIGATECPLAPLSPEARPFSYWDRRAVRRCSLW